jgi:lipoate-protein ligase A
MALDEALLDAAREQGVGYCRVYSWSQPTVSLGRHQEVDRGYSAPRAEAERMPFVRRLTGGRALMHHREITYAVASRREAGHRPREDYRRVNALLIAALRRLGVADIAEVERASSTHQSAARPGEAACFEEPAVGELVLRGAKLVGSAQVQERGAWLQHGSILIDDDQSLLAGLTSEAPLNRPAATLRAALGRAPHPEEFADVLLTALREQWDAASVRVPLDPPLAERARHFRQRYADPDWTWRGTYAS